MNNILSKKEINNVINKKALDGMSGFDALSEITDDDLLTEIFDKMNQDDKKNQESHTSDDDFKNVADEQLEYLKTLN